MYYLPPFSWFSAGSLATSNVWPTSLLIHLNIGVPKGSASLLFSLYLFSLGDFIYSRSISSVYPLKTR